MIHYKADPLHPHSPLFLNVPGYVLYALQSYYVFNHKIKNIQVFFMLVLYDILYLGKKII